MPKQARGFWTCSFCGIAFDQYEEAEYHECEECQRGRSQNHPTEDVHRPPEIVPGYPFDSREERRLATPETRQRRRPRRMHFVGPNESLQLSDMDAIACRNIEVFEADDSYIIDAEGHKSFFGQVGLRCIACAERPTSDPGSYEFPMNLSMVSGSIRRIAEGHLVKCKIFHHEAKQKLREALDRQRSHLDEESFSDLHAFALSRCQYMKITDRHPGNFGIIFQDYDELFATLPIPFETRRMDQPEMSPIGFEYRPAPAHPASLTYHFGGIDYPPQTPPLQGKIPLDRRSKPSAIPTTHPQEYNEMNQIDSREGLAPLPMEEPLAASSPVTLYDVPTNFPFMQDPMNGDWVCKYCIYLHPQHRDPQYRWSSPSGAPPPTNFIDHHMNLCRGYQQSFQHYPYEYHTEPGTYHPYHHYGQRPYSRDYPESAPPASGTGAYSKPPPTVDYARRRSHQSPLPRLHEQTRGSPTHSSTEKRHRTPNLRDRNTRSDPAYQKAIEYLAENDKSMQDADGNQLPESHRLVIEEDKLLLTDYFFHLMRQLRLVRFSEEDRKTRGGKREKVKVGYGGLQCVHCADQTNSRKFFWSNVDRLANSFAEIPGHVLKCRHCPKPIKNSLLKLKESHADQMSRLPRGSQKVFFRRMWRRIHNEDPDLDRKGEYQSISPKSSGTEPSLLPMYRTPSTINSPATAGSDESILLLERPTIEAAKVLSETSAHPGPLSPSSRVLLSIPEDKEWLSDTDCFIRRQIEVFCATSDDILMARKDRKYPIKEQQVGIRCIHCALSKEGASGHAVAYPFSINGIYESTREIQRIHLDECQNLPIGAKAKLEQLKGAASLSSVLRKYYVLAAKALGLQDTNDGIFVGGETVPLGPQAAFAFSGSPESDEASKDASQYSERKRSPERVEDSPIKKTRSG